MKTKSNAVVRLGDLVALACERAAAEACEPREVTRRAAIATVRALLCGGNLAALCRLAELEESFA
jgi:hypothetical protein